MLQILVDSAFQLVDFFTHFLRSKGRVVKEQHQLGLQRETRQLTLEMR